MKQQLNIPIKRSRFNNEEEVKNTDVETFIALLKKQLVANHEALTYCTMDDFDQKLTSLRKQLS